jgi:hypothetical protein
MPSSGCNQLRATEPTAGVRPPTVGAASSFRFASLSRQCQARYSSHDAGRAPALSTAAGRAQTV